MDGYILEITEEKASVKEDFFSGVVDELSLPACICPNCQSLMFPVINVRYDSVSMGSLVDKKVSHGNYITFDVCPCCPHSLRNYCVTFDADKKNVIGGYMDHRGIASKMDTPYESRVLKINKISGALWNDDAFVDKYQRRNLFDGVCHQLGGVKLKSERYPIDSCMCCGNDNLSFVAMIDNDDLNVPLYESGEPRALTIGDQSSLNVFACNKCYALNYCITE